MCLVIFRYVEWMKFELNNETKETHYVIVIVSACTLISMLGLIDFSYIIR